MIYGELEKAVLPHMTDYQEDLTLHDKKWITENPKTPFLHFSSNTGTHFITFDPGDSYPPKGKIIPYLFGTAERGFILEERIVMAKYFNKERYYAKRVHYFDGESLKEIDHGEAIRLATEYVVKIKAEWSWKEYCKS